MVVYDKEKFSKYDIRIVDLLCNWQKSHGTASIVVKGIFETIPDRIYIYNFRYDDRLSFFDMQRSYLAILTEMYGPDFIYEDPPCDVEFITHCPGSNDDVVFKIEGDVYGKV